MFVFLSAALAVLCLLVIYYGVRGFAAPIGDLHQLEGRTTYINVAALKVLVSPAFDSYLRGTLATKPYRRIRRRQLLLIAQNLQAMFSNSAVLIRLAQVLKSSSDPRTAEVAQQLFDEAVEIRASILSLWCKTFAAAVFLNQVQVLETVVASYERMKGRIVDLRGWMAPDLQESQVTSWL